MSRSELLQLMAAQIFAGLTGGQFLKTISHQDIQGIAQTAVKAAVAIQGEVAKIIAPPNQDPG